MDLTIIVAVSDNNVIGIENRIPWHIKEDLQRFRDLTLNHPVIMGRRTYDSLPQKFKPLPWRKNIVISRNLQSSEGIYIARNIEEVLILTENQDAYIIGGKSIYELTLPLADKIELTRVHQYFEGDVFFPKVRWKDWILVKEERKKNEQGLSYSFLTYQRKIKN